MSHIYNSQTITGYNADPPVDDGSQTDDNRLSWSKHKNKLADPIKALAEAINTELMAAFDLVAFNSVTAVSTNLTVTNSHQGHILSVTNEVTITMPTAVGRTGFVLGVVNNGSDDVTVTGDGSETINGSANIVLAPNASLIITSDGSNWAGPQGTPHTGYDRQQFEVRGAFTSVAGAVTSGNNAITVDDANGFFETESIITILDNDAEHSSTITDITSNVITIADAVPGGRTIPDGALFRSDISMPSSTSRRWVEGRLDFFLTNHEGLVILQEDLATDAVGQDAIAAGAVGQSEIATDAVGQAELKTTQSTNSDSTTGSFVTLDIPGGSWSFTFETRSTGSGDNWLQSESGRTVISTSFRTEFRFNRGTMGGSRGGEIRARSISASPPYNLGDGEFSAFVMLRVASDGEIMGAYVSEDAPWYGTTFWGRPKYVRKSGDRRMYGRWYRRTITVQDVIEDRATMADYDQQEPEITELEITPSVRALGASEKPHPFSTREDGDSVIMLDPMSRVTQRLVDLMLQGEDVTSLIRAHKIVIGDELDRRTAPPGIAMHGVSFKR